MWSVDEYWFIIVKQQQQHEIQNIIKTYITIFCRMILSKVTNYTTENCYINPLYILNFIGRCR